MRNRLSPCCFCISMLLSAVVGSQEPVPLVSPEEAAWLEANPEAIVDLSALPPDQLQKFVDIYQGLTPEEQDRLRENAGELQALSPEEQAWALDNPAAVGQIGKLSQAERQRLLELYRKADPATQRRLRNQKN
jgi:hypothetical protein